MRRTVLGASVALAGLLTMATGAVAQDDMDGMAPHPAHIHAGLCPAPGDVVAPLNDVSSGMGDAAGAASGIPTVVSFTAVEIPLADIVAADHSIVVHMSADDMATYIACGDLGGTIVDTGMGLALTVGMAPLGGTDLQGVALLLEMPDGNTGVDVLLFHASDLPS